MGHGRCQRCQRCPRQAEFRSVNNSAHVICRRQTRDQDERSHLLPGHRGGLLRPPEECAQSKWARVRAWVQFVSVCHRKHHPAHLFYHRVPSSITVSPSHPSPVLSLFLPPPLLTSQTAKEPQPVADLQCEDPRSSVLHGGAVAGGHANLDGCGGDGRGGTHAFHGLSDSVCARDESLLSHDTASVYTSRGVCSLQAGPPKKHYSVVVTHN